MSTKVVKKEIRFVDLFSGIGGFHVAINNFSKKNNIGARLVLASDIDENAKEIYRRNFKTDVLGDIRDIKDLETIDDFEILFAGFPCQPFSKGGKREGFNDETRGTLFFEIERFLEKKKPKYFLLENVSNLVSHDGGNTYNVITARLKEMGYLIPSTPLIISPNQVGIPSLRPRVYIPGILSDDEKLQKHIDTFSSYFPKVKSSDSLNINLVIEGNSENIPKKYYLNDYEKMVLNMWDEFYKNIDLKTIGFPVWSDHFVDEFDVRDLPKWKADFINKNIELYKRNREFIDMWKRKWDIQNNVIKTHRKLEWQAGADHDSIFDCLIQFRPSGVRVKRPNYFSTLVAMNHSQIVGRLGRRLTPNETKRLQSFPEDFLLHEDSNVALKQLGNAVNSKVVERILDLLLNEYEKNN